MWRPLDCSSFTNTVITFQSVLTAFVALCYFFLNCVLEVWCNVTVDLKGLKGFQRHLALPSPGETVQVFVIPHIDFLSLYLIHCPLT